MQFQQIVILTPNRRAQYSAVGIYGKKITAAGSSCVTPSQIFSPQHPKRQDGRSRYTPQQWGLPIPS
jgi:hypothetical protein